MSFDSAMTPNKYHTEADIICDDGTGVVITYNPVNESEKDVDVPCNQDLWALAASCAGFYGFGIIEMVYAFISHSLCLLVDSTNSMVDGTLFCMSFFIELYKAANNQKQLPYSFLLFTEVYFPLFATLVLIAFMIEAICKSIPILINPNDNDVDIMYVFIFGSLNLVIDLIVAAFYVHDFVGFQYGQKVVMEDKTCRSGTSTPGTPLVVKPNIIEVDDKNYIMVSAVIHLGSDILNAMLEIGAASFAYFGHYNANICDATAALVSAFIVIAICIWFLYDISCAYQRLERNKDKLGGQTESLYEANTDNDI